MDYTHHSDSFLQSTGDLAPGIVDTLVAAQ